ncbi:MAG: helix-turn-helix domain-containing protein [Zoogloeaceae bacterium]|jgi:cytoskeleton protein RodZ|nr:helix-turn-helix domain-containing protein [Zoogloeaceae bacterium]
MSGTRTSWLGRKDKTPTAKAEVAPEAAIAQTPAGLRHVREALQSSLVEQLEQIIPSADALLAGSQPADPPAAEVRVGRQLEAAREAQKLEVSDVAQRLRLGERQVLALESGDLAALPGRTFVRGFVRNYARVVNLEAAPLLEILDGVDKLSAPRLELPESTHVVMPGRQEADAKDSSLVAVTGLVLLLIAVLLYFFLPEQSWMPVRGGQWTEEDRQAEAEPDADNATPVLEESESVGSAPVTLAADAPEPEAPSASAAPPSSPVADNGVQFSFIQESWVEVRDRNDVVLSSRQHAAGTRHVVSGAPPLTVTVGKASGVTLTYRGKPVSLQPNAENDVARVVLP